MSLTVWTLESYACDRCNLSKTIPLEAARSQKEVVEGLVMVEKEYEGWEEV